MAQIVGKTYPIAKTTSRRAPRKTAAKKATAAAAPSKSDTGKDTVKE